MNFSLHIITSRYGIFKKYPKDSIADLFCKKITNLQFPTFIVDKFDKIQYYTFCRPINKTEQIAIIVGVNNSRAKNIHRLFSVLSDFISKDLPGDYSIITYDNNGELRLNTGQIPNDSFATIRTRLDKKLEKYSTKIKWVATNIPETTPTNNITEFPSSCESSEVYLAVDNGNTVFIKSDTDSVSSVLERTITKLRNDICEKETTIGILKSDIKTLKRKQKQFRVVLSLLGVLIIASIGLYFVYNNLKETEEQLAITNTDLVTKTQERDSLKLLSFYRANSIDSLNYELDGVRTKMHKDSIIQASIIDSLLSKIVNLEEIQYKIQQQYNTLTSYSKTTPMFITNINRNGSQLIIKYKAANVKYNVPFDILMFNNSGYIGQSRIISHIYTGTNNLKKTVTDLNKATFIAIKYKDNIIGGGFVN